MEATTQDSSGRRIVGLVTAVGDNYGSLLQAYALKNCIESASYRVEVVNTRQVARSLPSRIVRGTSVIYSVARKPKYLKFFLMARMAKRKSTISLSDGLLNGFEEFRRVQLLSETSYTKYGGVDYRLAYVAGSDQIWHLNSHVLSDVFFMRFAKNYKRVAYAPSFGSDTVPDYNRKRLAKYLMEIPYLSIREQSGVKIIKELTGRDAALVLDPVLLAGKEFWEDNVKNIKKRNRKYMVCYFLSNAGGALEIIDSISKALNLEVIWINTGVSYENKDFLPFEASPLEFVSLFMNTSFVCTDSFHGTAFSVMFGVPFYVFRRQYEIFSRQHTRIESFLSLMHLESRLWNGDNETDFSDVAIVNFDFSKNVLQKMRRESSEYLKNALESVEKNSPSFD